MSANTDETIAHLKEWKELIRSLDDAVANGTIRDVVERRQVFTKAAEAGWPATIAALEAALAEIKRLKALAALGWREPRHV